MEIAVLGSMKIIVEGAHVDLTSATQRRILAALVVFRGQVVAPERLADMAGVSRRALRTAISRIRSEAQLEEARRASPADALGALDSALAPWRGDPFGDCVDTEWAPPATARLAEPFASTIEDRGETLIARGRHGDASAAMAIHSSTHRLRDRPVELLMRGSRTVQGAPTEAHG